MPYKVLVFSINSGSAGMRQHLKREAQYSGLCQQRLSRFIFKWDIDQTISGNILRDYYSLSSCVCM